MKRIQIPNKRKIELGIGFTEIEPNSKANVYCGKEYLGLVEILTCSPTTMQMKVEEYKGAQHSNFNIGGIPVDCSCIDKNNEPLLTAIKFGSDNIKDFTKWIERRIDITNLTRGYIYRWRWIKMAKNLPVPEVPKDLGPLRCKCGHYPTNLSDEIYMWKLKNSLKWHVEVKREGGISYPEIEKILLDVINYYKSMNDKEV